MALLMTGKEKCELLRTIRREIAETNDIIYLSTDCNYQGDDCTGTCPKCDAEIRYLENELNRRAAQGYAVLLSGLSAKTYQDSVQLHNDWVPVVDREHTVGLLEWNGSNQNIPISGGFLPFNPGMNDPIEKLDLPQALVWWLN